MKAFHSVAVPHKDILEGRLTMDVFAADLWEVCQGRGPNEYRDGKIFFKKTYLTRGLENLLGIVEKRLTGRGGDPVIQIQTPFGGGKTHSLIALYHKCREWGAKPVVIVGTAMSSKQTIWGLMEQQLTGTIERFKDFTSPGKEALRSLLVNHEPVLILMDEVLAYATKASGEKVGESTLAGQTMAFMQEITEAVATLEKACLVVTLPASVVEHYDEAAERLFQQLQKISGRVEKIYTPVEDQEIAKVIRRRLFSSIDEKEAEAVVSAFIDYAEKENILPEGVQPSEYRDRFLDSYPFLPDLIDILYHRWGTFPTFQRTRGVLRLLSLLIHSVKDKNLPYITPAEYDLANQEVRQEFLRHIGSQFNSVIAADITDNSSGARKVDAGLGDAYKGLHLGVRVTTTIFLYSFSGRAEGIETGATAKDIKRSATTMTNPASIISEVLEQLKTQLFYLQNEEGKYFFSNLPNLNRIVLTKMENIKNEEVIELEKELLRSHVGGSKLKVFIWETSPSAIPDTEELKLVILPEEKKDQIEQISTTKGQTRRVYCNTLFFLFPMESERPSFYNTLRRRLAYESLNNDSQLHLTEEQKKTVREELKNIKKESRDLLRRFYRLVEVPNRDGFKRVDLGIPAYGDTNNLDREVYNKLRDMGEIIEKIAPIIIREKYLAEKDCASTVQIYQATLRTPGEPRMADGSVLTSSIVEGVKNGIFGLGELANDSPLCRYFKEAPTVALYENEVIIKESLCKEQLQKEEAGKGIIVDNQDIGAPDRIFEKPKDDNETGVDNSKKEVREKVHLEFYVPKGKMSQLMGTFGYLQTKFDKIKLSIIAEDGEISEQEYENKVKETFRQLGIDLE
ncbi:MAG: ATP-binding protein [Firmicutes bacterium]|nr:ATP-binding protein [Bacillota bacterium]